MRKQSQEPTLSVMLAVPNTQSATEWYKHAMGAKLLWSLGSVAGLEIAGAPFFLGEPAKNGWESPSRLGTTTTRIELFCENPDMMIAGALEAGATSTLEIKDNPRPWGIHRQGAFTDPFGHIWFVGDKSPLGRYQSK